MYFPFFILHGWRKKIRYPAADDLFRVSLETDMRRRFPFQGKLASTIDGRTFTTRRYTKTL